MRTINRMSYIPGCCFLCSAITLLSCCGRETAIHSANDTDGVNQKTEGETVLKQQHFSLKDSLPVGEVDAVSPPPSPK